MVMTREVNLETDMMSDTGVIAYCADRATAKEFYSALCNMRWRLINKLPDDERIMNALRGEEPAVWSCSWRYAGGIIADIRNQHYNTAEQYIDFYCSGNEGYVSELVEECLKKLGWEPYPWDDDGTI
jgi:hypothetical protein